MDLWLDAVAPLPAQKPLTNAPNGALKASPAEWSAPPVPRLPPLSAERNKSARLPLHAKGLRLLSAVRALDWPAAKAAGGAATLARIFSSPTVWLSPSIDGPLGVVQTALTQAIALTLKTPASDAFLAQLIEPLGELAKKNARGMPGRNDWAPWLNEVAHLAAINGNDTLWALAFKAAADRATLLPALLPLCLPFGGEGFIRSAIACANADSSTGHPGQTMVQQVFVELSVTRDPEVSAHRHALGERSDTTLDDEFSADGFGRLDAMKALLSCETVSQEALNLALSNCMRENRSNSSIFLLQNGAEFHQRPRSNGGSNRHSVLYSALELSALKGNNSGEEGAPDVVETALLLTEGQNRRARNHLHDSKAKRGSSDWVGDEHVSWLSAMLINGTVQTYNETTPKARARQLLSRGVLPLDSMDARFCLERAVLFGDAHFVNELAQAFKQAGVPADMSNSSILTKMQDIVLIGPSSRVDSRDARLADIALVLGELGTPSRMQAETAKTKIGPRFFAANEAIRLRQTLAASKKERAKKDEKPHQASLAACAAEEQPSAPAEESYQEQAPRRSRRL